MRKVLLSTAVLVLFVFAANAQDLDLKGGFGYAMQSEKLGLNIGAKYGITSEIDAEAGFTFFVPETGTVGGVDYRYGLWMFDVNGHYNFGINSDFYAYPLLGFNVTGTRDKRGNNKSSNTELGLNIGGGAVYEITSALGAFVELKYITGQYDQGMFGFGIYYDLR